MEPCKTLMIVYKQNTDFILHFEKHYILKNPTIWLAEGIDLNTPI